MNENFCHQTVSSIKLCTGSESFFETLEGTNFDPYVKKKEAFVLEGGGELSS